MNANAAAKISMMEDSVRCLTFGLLGLLPFIGLPYAFLALWVGGRVRRLERRFWNVGKPYRLWGTVCGGLGAVVWVVLLGLIIFNAVTGTWSNNQ